MTVENYAGVLSRVKSVVADSVVIMIFMFIVAYAFSAFEHVPDNARIIAFIFIFFLYDPIFTSLFGGTIGHFLIGIRVKRENNHKRNIILPLAIIRFFVKVLLGWISLLTFSGNKRRKAIHDYLVGSVVIYNEWKEAGTNANIVQPQ